MLNNLFKKKEKPEEIQANDDVEAIENEEVAPDQKHQTSDKNGVTWQLLHEELYAKSEKKAWAIAAVMTGVSAILGVAVVLMMPLKQNTPYIIQVNKLTGETAIVNIANEKDIPYSEVMDKYWLNRYLISRETYDWRTLQQDYDITRELSLPDVFDQYDQHYGNTNKDSLQNTIQDRKRMLVEIKSITPTSEGIASIRFTKKVVTTKDGREESRSEWIATVGYTYYPNYGANEKDRLLNPFGFKVVNYRVDADV